MVNDRVFIRSMVSYNRHGYESSNLYPDIRLESNTELLSLFLNGRFLLGPIWHRLNPYVFAGPGVSIVSTPAITRPANGNELLIYQTSETKFMCNVGGGLDFRIKPLLIMYLETSYNTSLNGQEVRFLPILVGFRTFPAGFFNKR